MGNRPAMPRLRNPVVLIHGLGARATYGPVNYFYRIPTRLRVAGNQVFVPHLPAWRTIPHRAELLKRMIEKKYPEGMKVNLIGHSLGGLDARYLASRLDFAHRVASVTTIGTPNHGSSLSDLALGKIPEATKLALEALLKFTGLNHATFHQVTRANCKDVFNRECTDVPGVAYYSATSRIGPSVIKQALPIFWITHSLLKKSEGENDGFVSVESARWGEHICTFEGDHYGQIGQILGRSRGLDHYEFFRTILSRLADDGF